MLRLVRRERRVATSARKAIDLIHVATRLVAPVVSVGLIGDCGGALQSAHGVLAGQRAERLAPCV